MTLTPLDLPAGLRRRFAPGVAIAPTELAALLGDTDPTVRSDAARALARVRPAPSHVVRALADAVLRPPAHADDEGHDQELERARESPELEPHEAFAAMDDFAARMAAADTLARVRPEGAAVTGGLIEGLAAARIPVRVAAARALVPRAGVSDPARAALIEGLGAGVGWFVRAAAARAIAEWGPAAAEALPALRAASSKGSEEVVVAVALALWRVAGDTRDAVNRLVGVLDRAPYHERAGALDAVAEMGPAAAAAVPALLAGLEDYGAPFRYDVVRALGAIGPAAVPAVPGIAAALGDPGPLVREAAAIALGAIGPAATAALGALDAAREDQTDPGGPDRGLRFTIAGRTYARHGALLIAVNGLSGSVARARAAAAAAFARVAAAE